MHGQYYEYCVLFCVWNIFSLGVLEAFDSKGITSAMECVDVANFTFATWQIRSCLLCKFISPGACLLSFPSTFRSFRQENRIVELFYWSKFRDRKGNEIFASQAKNALKHARITSLVGKWPPTKDSCESRRCSFHFRCEIVITTPKAPVFSSFAILGGFLTDYEVEVNSLAVWSKRVMRLKGKLIICWGKKELARTCSIYINAQDNHSKFTAVA